MSYKNTIDRIGELGEQFLYLFLKLYHRQYDIESRDGKADVQKMQELYDEVSNPNGSIRRHKPNISYLIVLFFSTCSFSPLEFFFNPSLADDYQHFAVHLMITGDVKESLKHCHIHWKKNNKNGNPSDLNLLKERLREPGIKFYKDYLKVKDQEDFEEKDKTIAEMQSLFDQATESWHKKTCHKINAFDLEKYFFLADQGPYEGKREEDIYYEFLTHVIVSENVQESFKWIKNIKDIFFEYELQHGEYEGVKRRLNYIKKKDKVLIPSGRWPISRVRIHRYGVLFLSEYLRIKQRSSCFCFDKNERRKVIDKEIKDLADCYVWLGRYEFGRNRGRRVSDRDLSELFFRPFPYTDVFFTEEGYCRYSRFCFSVLENMNLEKDAHHYHLFSTRIHPERRSYDSHEKWDEDHMLEHGGLAYFNGFIKVKGMKDSEERKEIIREMQKLYDNACNYTDPYSGRKISPFDLGSYFFQARFNLEEEKHPDAETYDFISRKDEASFDNLELLIIDSGNVEKSLKEVGIIE